MITAVYKCDKCASVWASDEDVMPPKQLWDIRIAVTGHVPNASVVDAQWCRKCCIEAGLIKEKKT